MSWILSCQLIFQFWLTATAMEEMELSTVEVVVISDLNLARYICPGSFKDNCLKLERRIMSWIWCINLGILPQAISSNFHVHSIHLTC
ncbi:hypothetical protein N431DRAFT_428741 [Stipitochalara longipes BDJ]|nr:hypothetical protein N431DRAFT_428741 [Stipitochalara longipes BDJ]